MALLMRGGGVEEAWDAAASAAFRGMEGVGGGWWVPGVRAAGDGPRSRRPHHLGE